MLAVGGRWRLGEYVEDGTFIGDAALKPQVVAIERR
jgi:hypothetical protein